MRHFQILDRLQEDFLGDLKRFSWFMLIKQSKCSEKTKLGTEVSPRVQSCQDEDGEDEKEEGLQREPWNRKKNNSGEANRGRALWWRSWVSVLCLWWFLQIKIIKCFPFSIKVEWDEWKRRDSDWIWAGCYESLQASDIRDPAAHLWAQVTPDSSRCWCRKVKEAGLRRGCPATGWNAPLTDRSQSKSPRGSGDLEAGLLCREESWPQWSLKEKKNHCSSLSKLIWAYSPFKESVTHRTWRRGSPPAQCCWAATRTHPDRPDHQGCSWTSPGHGPGQLPASGSSCSLSQKHLWRLSHRATTGSSPSHRSAGEPASCEVAACAGKPWRKNECSDTCVGLRSFGMLRVILNFVFCHFEEFVSLCTEKMNKMT